MDGGRLTARELEALEEAVVPMIGSSSEKISEAAKDIFEKAEAFKNQRVQEDVARLPRLAAIQAKAQELDALAAAMDPMEQEKEVAELSDEVHGFKEFFTTKIAEEAVRVRDLVETLEIRCVFPIVTDLEDFGRVLEKKAAELERV